LGLSENEQKVLDELERQLTGSKVDAKAKKASQVNGRVKYGRLLVIGSLLVVAGLVLMFVAITVHQVLLGVASFIAMLAGLYLVSQNWTTKAYREINSKTTPKNGSKPGSTGFFQARWDERNKD
jgi:hypothetical protein